MNDFSTLLKLATEKITPEYFNIPLYKGEYISRERVYCYELYHQLRLIWPEESKFILHGELDKVAHPYLSSLNINQKPDFLVHEPGSMNNNCIVMEIKKHTTADIAILNDFKKIEKFITKVGYSRGVFLMFGSKAINKSQNIQNILASFSNQLNVEIWLHCNPCEAAFRVNEK